jgi:predicted Rossmann fold flavoprotein
MQRAGRKLLITGKGRCNITNNSDIPEYLKQIFPMPKFCRPMFSRFFVTDILQFFRRLGIPTIEERGQRIFPQSQRAMDVVDALVRWNTDTGVRINYQSKVDHIITENGTLKGVSLDSGTVYTCNACILTTGGRSYPSTGSTGDGYRMAKELGHHIIPTYPALVPLETKGDLAPSMQGLSLKNVRASLWVDNKKIRSEFGEMLFTHFGLSGPILLSLSRDAVIALNNDQHVEIEIDSKAALDEDTVNARLLREMDTHGKSKLKTMLKSLVPIKMILPLCEYSALDPEKYCNQISATERKRILQWLKHLRFTVTGHTGWNDAIITSGGIDLKEINASTMESKYIPKLYFAGEILDLDAATGGFNLQIAWSSGYVAGSNAAQQ